VVVPGKSPRIGAKQCTFYTTRTPIVVEILAIIHIAVSASCSLLHRVIRVWRELQSSV
jgi:hypothetical protein